MRYLEKETDKKPAIMKRGYSLVEYDYSNYSLQLMIDLENEVHRTANVATVLLCGDRNAYFQGHCLNEHLRSGIEPQWKHVYLAYRLFDRSKSNR